MRRLTSALFLFTACSETPTGVSVESVRLSVSDTTTVFRRPVAVEATPLKNGAAVPEPVTWNSRDPAIVTVEALSSDGRSARITATGIGMARVEATAGEQTGVITIRVLDTVYSVSLSPANARVLTGDGLTLVATVEGPPAASQEIVWRISSGTIVPLTATSASVSFGLTPGEVTVTAESAVDETKRAESRIAIDQPRLVFATQPGTSIANGPLTPAPRVAIQNAAGETVTSAARAVTLALRAGGPAGSLSGTLSASSVDGIATFTDVKVDRIGAGFSLDATTPDGLPVTSSAFDVVIGPPRSIAVTMGDAQIAPVTSTFALAVQVRDAFANPVSNTTVAFATSSGGGAAASPVQTDDNGIASTTWTLDTLAGAHEVIASVTETNPLLMTIARATALPLAPSRIIKHAGDSESGFVWAQVPIPAAVRVTDRYDNPVPEVSVSFDPRQGGAVVESSVLTSSAGIATARWRLGGNTGPQTMDAWLTADVTLTTQFAVTARQCPAAELVLGVTTNGALTNSDCVRQLFPDIRFLDSYTLAIPSGETRVFALRLTTPDFAPGLEWHVNPGSGSSQSREAFTSDSEIIEHFALASGTHEFRARSSNAYPSAVGNYAIEALSSPSSPNGCSGGTMNAGTAFTHSLDLNCNATVPAPQQPSSEVSSKFYSIYQAAGKTLVARMTSNAFDPVLEASTSGETRIFLGSDDNSGGGTTAMLTVPAPSAGRFVNFRATHVGGSGRAVGSYTISIDP